MWTGNEIKKEIEMKQQQILEEEKGNLVAEKAALKSEVWMLMVFVGNHFYSFYSTSRCHFVYLNHIYIIHISFHLSSSCVFIIISAFAFDQS